MARADGPLDISVAQVRRVLAVLRARWSAMERCEGTADGLRMPVALEGGRVINPEDFALRFLLCQHGKKCASTRSRAAGAEERPL
jgi:hypothetical protein